jgi:hypothetical protein
MGLVSINFKETFLKHLKLKLKFFVTTFQYTLFKHFHVLSKCKRSIYNVYSVGSLNLIRRHAMFSSSITFVLSLFLSTVIKGGFKNTLFVIH